MTCDDKNNLPSVGTQEKRDLKRKLDTHEFINDANNDRSDNVNNISPENCKKLLKSDSGILNDESLVHEDQENTKNVDNKRKLAPKQSRRRKKRLEIETEFKILQSLIPKVADKQTTNEVSFKPISVTSECIVFRKIERVIEFILHIVFK
jgi:hypothetical protein